jgi:hypothetical protein
MNDENEVIEAIDVTGKSPIPLKTRNISRSSAKKLWGLQRTQLSQISDGKERRLEEQAAELKAVKQRLAFVQQKLANACALLEATVRRHGTQVFDLKAIETTCARGRVRFEAKDGRITMLLNEELVAVDSE